MPGREENCEKAEEKLCKTLEVCRVIWMELAVVYKENGSWKKRFDKVCLKAKHWISLNVLLKPEINFEFPF